MSVFVPIPCCFDYCNFVVLSEIWEGYVSSFVLFSLKIILAIQRLLCFNKKFRIIFSVSVKNATGILLKIALNL